VSCNHIGSVDPVQVCASVIIKALNDFDVSLDDSFCDAQNLKHALCNTNIPEPVLRFFGHLYDFNPQTYNSAAKAVMTEEVIDQDNDAEEDDSQSDEELSVRRCRKIQSIF